MAKRGVVRKYTPVGRRIARFGPQYVLARILGVSQQTISKKLRGKCVIKLSDLETLAEKLGVPIGAFFDWEQQACEWFCHECNTRKWVSYAMLVDVGCPTCSQCDDAPEMELVDDEQPFDTSEEITA